MKALQVIFLAVVVAVNPVFDTRLGAVVGPRVEFDAALLMRIPCFRFLVNFIAGVLTLLVALALLDTVVVYNQAVV